MEYDDDCPFDWDHWQEERRFVAEFEAETGINGVDFINAVLVDKPRGIPACIRVCRWYARTRAKRERELRQAWDQARVARQIAAKEPHRDDHEPSDRTNSH